jgi:transposase
MQVKTIINRIEKYKSFVYGKVQMIENGKQLELEVQIRPRRNSQPACSGCGQRRPGYDTLGTRHFEYVPIWGILVYFVYAMRRVGCPQCGVKVEQVPWAQGKRSVTNTYGWFLARWARRMSWSEVATSFHTSWHIVFSAVEMAVEWGRKNMNMAGITAIGVDEMKWGHGHHYITVVYQIDKNCKRLLWIGEHRTIKTLLRFFHWLGKDRSQNLEFVCSDMWKAYLKVIAKKATNAINILDRFHIVAHMNKAIDKVRAEESKELLRKGYEPVLKKSRWLFLRRPENLSDKQHLSLTELLKYNLKSIKSYLLKEEFQLFWEYDSPYWAGVFLDKWCTKVMRSRIEPMKKVAKMLRNHRELILNWFKAQKEFSSGIVEGFNTKAKLTTRKSYGFRELKTLKLALYNNMEDLPEPEFTHKFF